jgi:hypothetical protein
MNHITEVLIFSMILCHKYHGNHGKFIWFWSARLSQAKITALTDTAVGAGMRTMACRGSGLGDPHCTTPRRDGRCVLFMPWVRRNQNKGFHPAIKQYQTWQAEKSYIKNGHFIGSASIIYGIIIRKPCLMTPDIHIIHPWKIHLLCWLKRLKKEPNHMAMSQNPGRYHKISGLWMFIFPQIWQLIWVNYNISLTWIKAIWGWFPLLTMISSEVVVRSL